MEIVINYDESSNEYKIYESSTDTVLVSTNISEGLCNLNLFLQSQNLLKLGEDILKSREINYHLDSDTMKSMIESNVNLMKKLQAGPGEFKATSNRFGQAGGSNGGSSGFRSGNKNMKPGSNSYFKNGEFGKSNKKFGNKKWKKF